MFCTPLLRQFRLTARTWFWIGFLVFALRAGAVLAAAVQSLAVLARTRRHFDSCGCKGG